MKSLSRALVGALVLTGLTTSLAAAQQGLVECKATGRVIMITMGTGIYKDQKLNCITSDFIDGLTPCAPVGGFTLSGGDNDPSILNIVAKREDFAQHTGGVVEHEMTTARIFFEGGFNSPGKGYQKSWSFDVDRISGHGTLQLATPDGGPLDLVCTGAADAK